jgi:CRISPR-associated endonuclease/helicase Cas3
MQKTKLWRVRTENSCRMRIGSALARSSFLPQLDPHELATKGAAMAQTDAGGEGTPTPAGHPGERRPDNGLRGRGGFTGNDSQDMPSDRNTRFIDTTLGILSQAQLAPHLAERVARVSLSIAEGEFASRSLDETLILEIHRRICGDLVPEYAGRWRTADVRVGNLQPPPSHRVPMQMRDYCADLQARWTEASAAMNDLTLELLAFAEGRFLTIHPFSDFYGRTNRLFLAEMLRRMDLPLVVLEPETPQARAAYFSALEAADHLDWQPLMNIWRERFEQSGISREYSQ